MPNIHAKRKRGEAPAKPGDEDYPAKDAFKKAAKTAKKEEVEIRRVQQKSRSKHARTSALIILAGTVTRQRAPRLKKRSPSS